MLITPTPHPKSKPSKILQPTCKLSSTTSTSSFHVDYELLIYQRKKRREETLTMWSVWLECPFDLPLVSKKTSNRDNFCMRDSNKTSFGALESPVNRESLLIWIYIYIEKNQLKLKGTVSALFTSLHNSTRVHCQGEICTQVHRAL